MRYMMKLLILGLIVILTGCANEPMIRISEENLASLEAKKSQVNGTDESVVSEEETAEEPEQTAVADTSQWSRLPDETVLELTDYLPYQANQMKQFKSSETNFTTYVDYYDAALQMMQVREMIQGKTHIHVYRWDQNQIQLVLEEDNVQAFDNYLQTAQNQTENVVTLLSGPLTVGTTWQYDAEHQSELIALYEEATIEEATYKNVVEVKTAFEGYQLHQYYAAGDGLVMTRQIPNEGETATESFAQVSQNHHKVMMVVSKEIASPQVEGDVLLATESVEFSWQTNDTLAKAFQRLFIEQGWMTDQMVINQMNVEGGTATVDFSAGIVAAINAHPATEVGVIPAIVATIGNFYGVEQVMLTVNGNGLSPDTLPYPPNGIYTMEESWFSADAAPETEAEALETEPAQETIELSIPTGTEVTE